MSKKVGKAKYRQMEKLIEDEEKKTQQTRRNAYIFTAIFTITDFLLGFFISSHRLSFAGLDNIGFFLVWVGIFFAVISTLLFTLSSLDEYYRYKNELERLKEEFEKMDV